MKKFVYIVDGFEFKDSEAFGCAWRAAKTLATDKHAVIYRLVIKGDSVKQEVFCAGGCFLRADLASSQEMKIF